MAPTVRRFFSKSHLTYYTSPRPISGIVSGTPMPGSMGEDVPSFSRSFDPDLSVQTKSKTFGTSMSIGAYTAPAFPRIIQPLQSRPLDCWPCLKLCRYSSTIVDLDKPLNGADDKPNVLTLLGTQLPENLTATTTGPVPNDTDGQPSVVTLSGADPVRT